MSDLTVPRVLCVCFGYELVEQKGGKPRDISEIEARLRVANEALDEVGSSAVKAPVNRSGLGLAFRIGLELVVAILFSTFLGWHLDQWLETGPWIMVTCVVLGAAAGVGNVYRVVRGLDDSVGLGQASRRKERVQRDP